MNILLTNDDGIHHPGLTLLAGELSKKHRVFVIAPEKQRSACAHQISIHSPVRFNKISKDTYITDGYPADCVKFALKGFLNEKIDFVASGINEGPNMGIDVFYSGTVAGAREGLINKIPSAAFSLNTWGNSDKILLAAIHAAALVDTLYEKYYKDNEMYNINYPNTEEYKGVRFTKLGNRVFKEIVIKRNDPSGREYFWLGGETPEFQPEENSDFTAVEEGYVSVTPLNLQLTDMELFSRLKRENC
jgi:5'-nucleotidase